MMKKNLLRLGALVLAVALCLSCVACKPNEQTHSTTESGEQITYTVKVTTEAGQAMEGVGVYIYTDSAAGDLIWFDSTDENGAMTFTNVQRDNYVAVLKDVPTGYEVAESYPITGEVTEIKLAAGVMTDDNMDDVQYKLGDMMMDFTVTGTDGTEYTMSELLKEKKAIVLNFWYINCNFCIQEFPYLQEAYEQYSDQVEFLALNPIDNDADAIAAFKEEHGLTFPVCSVDPKWGDMFQITGYPTTVIIDRYGNISLIHAAAAIDSTKQLADALEHYIADDYEAGVVEDINDLVIEEEVGSEANPEQLGASDMFEVTVEPGQVYYNEIGKVQKVSLTIYSNDAYIIYEGKTYKPNNGVVSVMISAPDMNTPAKVGYGNSGTEKQTFQVYMTSQKGSWMNPYSMTLGEFTAKVSAGNDQGIYYQWVATEEGFLTMKCLSATAGVDYMYFLYNLDSNAHRQLDTEGETAADGTRFVTMPVRKGQKVRFSIGCLPDDNNSYPAGTFKMLAEFTAGDIDAGQVQVEKATYTVSVVDNEGKPLSGINMKVQGTQEENKTVSAVLTTGEDGKVSQELQKGEYTVTLTTPKGYTVDQETLTLTGDSLSGVFTISPIVITNADYSITVLDPEDAPVVGLQVIIQGSNGSGLGLTNENGQYTENLQTGSYTVYVLGYDAAVYAAEVSYTFPEGETALTVKLGYAPGTEKNPIVVEAMPYTTDAIKANAGLYYTLSGVAGKQLEIVDTDAYVIHNGTTYGANSGGVAIVPMGEEDTVTLVVGNSGSAAESYTLKLNALYGTAENPEPISPADSLEIKLEAGDADGYTYRWTATDNGTLRVNGANVTILLTNTVTAQTCGADEALTVSLGDVVTVQVKAAGEELAAVQETLSWSFTVDGSSQPDDSSATTDSSETTEPSVSETTDPETEPSVSETTEPETEPTEPPVTEPEDNTLTYTVTVTDYAGTPSVGTSLMIQKNGAPVITGATDAKGQFSAELDAGDYTVTLLVTGLHYDTSEAVLSANDPNALILLAKVLSSSDSTTDIYAADNGYGYLVGSGGYYLNCRSGEFGYSTEYGATMFGILFPEAGKYRVSTTNDTLVVDCYNVSSYIMKRYETIEGENAVEIDIYDNSVKEMIFGIEGSGDCILKIVRLGEPGFDPDYVEPEEYTGSGDPVQVTFPGGTVTYVDVINGKLSDYALVYNETDGYYHLGTKTGPVMYANMGTVTKVNSISLDDMINGTSVGITTVGGTGVRASYYDEYGVFHKEDYTNLLIKYIAKADTKTGLYPLTKDLAYMLEMGIEARADEWANPESANYLFKPNTVNPDLYWMFLLCYVK